MSCSSHSAGADFTDLEALVDADWICWPIPRALQTVCLYLFVETIAARKGILLHHWQPCRKADAMDQSDFCPIPAAEAEVIIM